jgi:hypothetical protein
LCDVVGSGPNKRELFRCLLWLRKVLENQNQKSKIDGRPAQPLTLVGF